MICKRCKHFREKKNDGGHCLWGADHRYEIPECIYDDERIFPTDKWKKCPTFEAKPKEQKS